MDFVDFICKEVAEMMDGSDFCCDYLCDIDNACYESCDYSYAQQYCWKRYFTEKYKEAKDGET